MDRYFWYFQLLTVDIVLSSSVSFWEVGKINIPEIRGFEILRFPGNLCRDLWNFFFVSKDFSGTDIYHSDTKNVLLQN